MASKMDRAVEISTRKRKRGGLRQNQEIWNSFRQIPFWWLTLFLSVFPITFRQVSVSDAWWHVALGKWLVEQRTIPDLSKFYFSPFDAGFLGSELRWEWLGDMIFYLCYAAMGAAGLQWLVISCVMLSLMFLAKLVPKPSSPWTLLLLVAVCLGTYQLQLARNSVFSLALYPAVLWLGLRKVTPPDWNEHIVIGSVLVLWSCLHGSCVLGWTTALVIFGARALAAFRPNESRSREDGVFDQVPFWLQPLAWCRSLEIQAGLKSISLLCLAFSISLSIIVAGRGGAVDFLLQPVRHVTSSMTTTSPAPPVPSPQAPSPLKKTGIKEWLNSSIWKPDPKVPWSNDYWSPLDMLPGMRPIEVALGLTVVAGLCVAWFRSIPAGLFLAWMGSVFLGLGYVRMFGYMTLASGAVVIFSTRRLQQLIGPFGWASVGVWVAFSWWVLFTGQCEKLIPEGQHVSRFGQVPIFDDPVCDWVKTEFPHENVFTTIESGSYCLLRWGFEKPVFLDGFFAPHQRSVWDAYNLALSSGDPSVLHAQFGITVAVIPSISGPWVSLFLHSPDWNPVAIGKGTIVFLHRTVSLAGRSPKIFFNSGDLRETSAYFRYHALRNVFLVTAATSPNGFNPQQWTQHPAFNGFREMAKNVFPARPAD